MTIHKSINYLEFAAKSIESTKAFFMTVFDWSFEDYGPDYTAFSTDGMDGGFFNSEKSTKTSNGGALVVFYSENLEQTEQEIVKAGGKIVKQIFSFPGGRRFHFEEPSGNEFAVWSDS
ncbi:MAG: VOC family protein [Phycisphaerales bacterium]|nr:VOC family protein [Phycisphaerales bacterium]